MGYLKIFREKVRGRETADDDNVSWHWSILCTHIWISFKFNCRIFTGKNSRYSIWPKIGMDIPIGIYLSKVGLESCQQSWIILKYVSRCLKEAVSCESVCCRAATKSMTWMAGGPSQQLTLVTSISASLGGFSLFSRPFLGSSSLQPQLTTTRGLMGRLATLGKALQCCYAWDFDGKWLSNSPLCKTCV